MYITRFSIHALTASFTFFISCSAHAGARALRMASLTRFHIQSMQQPYYSLRFFSSSETPLQRHNAQRKLLFEKLHVACENHKALATQKQSLLERLSTVKKQLAQLSREAHEHLNSHNHDHENASIDAHVFSDALEHCAKYKQVIAETQEKIDACEKALNEAFQQKQDLESAINAVQK